MQRNVDDLRRTVDFLQLNVTDRNGLCHKRLVSRNEMQTVDSLSKLLMGHIGSLPVAGFQLVEYWVPVDLTRMQVQLYCEILLKNYRTLLAQSGKLSEVRGVISSLQLVCV